MKIKYCYLRVLYVDYNNTIIGYSLVFSSADFSEIYEEIVPSDKIFDVLNSGYTYDFNIVSGVLMCEDVPRITASETDYNLFSIKRRINFDDDTIYSFILEGMRNDYLIVDDSILEVDEYTGGAVAKFDRIQIAKSTMSMYVNMYDSSDIYHQTLAYLHDGIIELKPFYVAVPTSARPLKFDKIQVAKKINNVEYDIYVVKDVPIYSSAMITATALINKAVQMSLKYDAMIRGLESYMRFINEALGDTQESNYKWVGKNTSLKSDYGVYFESSMKKLTRKECNDVIDAIVYSIVPESANVADAMELLKKKGFSPLQLAAAVGIIHVVYATETVADCLSLGAQYLSDARRCKLKTDLFLYRIRVTSYIMRIPLVDKKRPILDGSEENAYTLVNACNYYGEVNR